MGDLIQFPGNRERGEAADTQSWYPYRVYPSKVKRLREGVYEPMPNPHWSNEEFLRWYLAVISLECALSLELRRARPSGGRYSLRIGARRALADLPDGRVWDLLGGVYEAAVQMEVLTDE